MEKYLRNTHGLMIYQEQLMQMACEIAGFTEAESDELRKALGKKREDKIALFHQRFIIGGKRHGYSKEILEDIWAEWLIRGFYLFTKSHFLCLTMISYQMMYLKVHYPDEFFMVMNEKS